MQRLPADAVAHLNPEGRERIPVISLFDKEAESLLDKGVERLLGGKVALAAGNPRPEKRRYINSIVTGLASHLSKSGSGVVFYGFEFFALFASCHDVNMATHGGKAEGVRLIEIGIDPLFIDLVGAAVLGERMQIPG